MSSITALHLSISPKTHEIGFYDSCSYTPRNPAKFDFRQCNNEEKCSGITIFSDLPNFSSELYKYFNIFCSHVLAPKTLQNNTVSDGGATYTTLTAQCAQGQQMSLEYAPLVTSNVTTTCSQQPAILDKEDLKEAIKDPLRKPHFVFERFWANCSASDLSFPIIEAFNIQSKRQPAYERYLRSDMNGSPGKCLFFKDITDYKGGKINFNTLCLIEPPRIVPRGDGTDQTYAALADRATKLSDDIFYCRPPKDVSGAVKIPKMDGCGSSLDRAAQLTVIVDRENTVFSDIFTLRTWSGDCPN